MKLFVFLLFILFCSTACKAQKNNIKMEDTLKRYEINKTEDEWKNILTPEEFNVIRQKGTEYPGTGEYNLFFEDGYYKCKACGNLLFASDTKFQSHCGWPSFYDIINNNAIKEIKDTSHNMIRTEVVCAKCGGHLGHVFDDGPNPTGLRYCINSVSIQFQRSDSLNSKGK